MLNFKTNFCKYKRVRKRKKYISECRIKQKNNNKFFFIKKIWLYKTKKAKLSRKKEKRKIKYLKHKINNFNKWQNCEIYWLL